MQLRDADLLIGCEPQRDLRFEIFLKVNSILRSLNAGQVWRRVADGKLGHLREASFPIGLILKRLGLCSARRFRLF
jgi:hypothetical protein